jgi:ABC-type multidrug transport system fused ATPase/permease subunit
MPSHVINSFPLLRNDWEGLAADYAIKLGRVVAFAGLTGAGKTITLKRTPRFCDVLSGGIRAGGQDMRNFQRESLRNHSEIELQRDEQENDPSQRLTLSG